MHGGTKDAPYIWNLDINLEMSSPINRLVSRSHSFYSEFSPDRAQAKVQVIEPLKSDFLLLFRSESINQASAISTINKYGEQAISLSVMPDLRPPKIRANTLPSLAIGKVDMDGKKIYDQKVDNEESDNGDYLELEPKVYEYIFLIDRSGSMDGDPMVLAVQALKLFLHSLPEGSKFNVVSFGSSYEKLFEKSLPYNEENFRKAIDEVSKFGASLGGTEIYSPLQDLLKQEADPLLPRHIYLLTDGAVYNTEEVVNLIRLNRESCFVHTFGIGSGASSELVKNCAIAGHGHYSFILRLDEIEQKVIEAL